MLDPWSPSMVSIWNWNFFTRCEGFFDFTNHELDFFLFIYCRRIKLAVSLFDNLSFISRYNVPLKSILVTVYFAIYKFGNMWGIERLSHIIIDITCRTRRASWNAITCLSYFVNNASGLRKWLVSNWLCFIASILPAISIVSMMAENMVQPVTNIFLQFLYVAI